MKNKEVFLLLDHLTASAKTKPSPYWLYIEDEKGLPVPLNKLDSYMQRYSKDDNKDNYIFYVCRRPSKHKRKHVINLRDFFVYVKTSLTPKEYVKAFMLRVSLDALLEEDEDTMITPELITQVAMKMNTYLSIPTEKVTPHV